MNMASLPLCEASLKKDGILLVNSSLVTVEPTRKDVRVIKVACNDIAVKLGDVKFANMVMMGAISKATGAVKLDKLEAVLKTFFPANKHKFIPMNMQAIIEGENAVK